MVDEGSISAENQAALDAPRAIVGKANDGSRGPVELKKLNPEFRIKVKQEPLAGTDLFESAVPQPSMTPPEWKKQSVTQTEAWALIQPHLGARQQQVFLAIDDLGPVTAKKVSAWLGIPINVVVARITELRDNLGIIEEHGTELDPTTNRNCTLYRVKSRNADPS